MAEHKIEPLAVASISGKIELLTRVILPRSQKLFFVKSSEKNKKISFDGDKSEIKITQINGKAESISLCSDFSFSNLNGEYIMLYTKQHKKGDIKKHIAISEDTKKWKVKGEIDDVKERACLAPHYTYKGHPITFIKKKTIHIAIGHELSNWKISNFTNSHYFGGRIGEEMTIAGTGMSDQGLVVFLEKKNQRSNGTEVSLYAMLLSFLAPNKIIWISPSPIWSDVIARSEEPRSLGIINLDDSLRAFWSTESGKIFSVVLPKLFSSPAPKPAVGHRLTKYDNNPIITPNRDNEWENFATFNPAAVMIDKTVHLLYRAQGNDGLSYLGYASSSDGLNFDGRCQDPAYTPRENFEGTHVKKEEKNTRYMSGGGWGGCEDPRMVLIDNDVYLTYTAFDGWSHPRMALSYISQDDFINKRWDKWSNPALISPPGMINKNWVLFPEKIDDKYAVLHSISPQILIDKLKSLKLDKQTYINSYYNAMGRKNFWDSWVRGAGPPPVKTPAGWLVLYHAMDRFDPGKYKLGVMILDENDPTKIKHRSARPILEPDMHYENHGFKSGVVYACGAVNKDGKLYVYYGGADSVTCVAWTDLDELLFNVKKDIHTELKLTPIKIKI